MASQIKLPEQNQVLLVGRLTRDPEVRFTQKGQAMARLGLAVNRRYKDAASGEWKEDTCFVSVVVWGPAAERCRDRLKKGSPVHVEGRLASNEWTDKSGQKRTTIEVISRRLQVLAASDTNPAGEEPASDIDRAATHTAEPAPEITDDVPF